jgi:hypothetical protein
VLLRYARLARALSLAVTDLILWISLTGASPFGGKPEDTTEFLRRLAVLRGTSLAVHDLDYLLRGQSAAESAIAFTSTQSTALLQTIRDAIAKAVAANALSLTSVSNATPIAIGTAKPHGLATGDRVLISGVSGNTAANGIFTITVTGPATFTLNGSAGNAAWMGGGTVTANLDATVRQVVIAALATATEVTADVVTPVLDKTGVLPLDAATIASLLAQSTVDPTHFPALVAAATRVANAAALFTALAPSSAAFAFAVANAGTFGWLDPSALPLTPVAASPYAAFEALLQALKLQQRQAARSPKLFDVLGQWLLPGGLPANVPTPSAAPRSRLRGRRTRRRSSSRPRRRTDSPAAIRSPSAWCKATRRPTGPSRSRSPGRALFPSADQPAMAPGRRAAWSHCQGRCRCRGRSTRASPTSPRSPLPSERARRRSIRPIGPGRSPTSRC